MGIRNANINDLSCLCELEKLFLSPFREDQVYYELMENPVGNYLVYEEDGVIWGFINFWITFDSATVCQIAVKEEYRNRGIATLLLEESFRILKENDVLTYTLEVRENNLEAYNLYLKLGFKKIVIKEKYYTNGENAIYMVKGMY